MRYIKKEVVDSFITGLLNNYEVIAPVLNEIHRFEIISSADEINLDFTNTLYPPKKFFLPNYETMFSYSKNKFNYILPDKKKVLFGIRSCDVHGLLVLDRFFTDDVIDPYYLNHRKNTIIIAIACTKGGEYCFCDSVGTDTVRYGYDLLFHQVKRGFLVEVGSKTGEALTKNKFFSETNQNPSENHVCTKTLDTSKLKLLKEKQSDTTWEENTKLCLSCGACVMTCPTCSCFAVHDTPEFDLVSGTRKRNWSSCQQKDFTKVAGNFVFREKRALRFKHRIYHKFDYFKDIFQEFMCIGCGRCIRNCPPRIDMIKIINEL